MKSKLTDYTEEEINNVDNPLADTQAKLKGGGEALPSISPKKKDKPVTTTKAQRKTLSHSFPEYVVTQLKDAAHKEKEPQNVVIMKALKLAGFKINEDDLKDGRIK